MKKTSNALKQIILFAAISASQAFADQPETLPVTALTTFECAVWTGAGVGYENDGIPAAVVLKVERLLDFHLKSGASVYTALVLVEKSCQASVDQKVI
jgi:hypothetical protein